MCNSASALPTATGFAVVVVVVVVVIETDVVVLILAAGEGTLELVAGVVHWRTNADFTAVSSR